MPSRRSRGDGGLYWDRSRQRWMAEVTIGYSPSGKRIVKKASGKTKTAAQRKLKEIIRDYEDGLAIAPHNYTVADAVREWLQYGLSGRSPKTIEKCTILANTHIIPATTRLRRAIRCVAEGDDVRLEGWLVDVEGEDDPSFHWTTSTSRDDEGPNSCETVYLERLTVGERAYE